MQLGYDSNMTAAMTATMTAITTVMQ